MLVSVVRVHEEHEGQPVWDGVVHVFSIEGREDASVCFAWSSPVDDSTNRKFYAVLAVPPITAAADAVRAAIISDFQKQKGSDHVEP